jgi:lipopolysaccharide biosynthesis regulator YciM
VIYVPKKIISVRFDEQLHELINQEAQKKGMKPSDYIRETLKGGLKEYEVSTTPSREQIGMPVKESEENPTEEEFEKRLEKQIKDLESKIAGIGKLPEAKEPEMEKAEIEPSDDELDKAIKEAGKEPEKKQTEQYMCGGCGYIDSKEFSPCPNCGNTLTW